MKRFGAAMVAVLVMAGTAMAQSDQRLAIIDEKLDKLRAEVEDLQFRQQKTQQQLDDVQAQINQLRKMDGGPAAADVAGLEAKIRAIDAAREKDKQVILDTLAKELANLGTSRATRPAGAAEGGTEHVVARGETLSTIAKTYGVTADAVAKANGITNPNTIQVGQKLVIPK